MRICVTGISGFIGSPLAEHLLYAGHDVVGIVRRPMTFSRGLSAIPLLTYDLAALPENAFNNTVGAIDAVVHLAGQAHVNRGSSADTILAYRRNNVIASERLARAAIAAGVGRFVFVSTIGVRDRQPEAWSDSIARKAVEPATPYAQSKAEAEHLLNGMLPAAGVALTIVRPALVVGAKALGNLARLARLIKRGLPIPVPRNDNQRAFVGLHNLIDLLERCLTSPEAAGELFLAAEPQGVSTRQAMTWIAQGMGRTVRLPRMPGMLLQAGASALGQRVLHDKLFGDLHVDASHAQRKLGWTSVRPLEDEFRDLGRHTLSS